jgi:hypothetical protein
MEGKKAIRIHVRPIGKLLFEEALYSLLPIYRDKLSALADGQKRDRTVIANAVKQSHIQIDCFVPRNDEAPCNPL